MGALGTSLDILEAGVTIQAQDQILGRPEPNCPGSSWQRGLDVDPGVDLVLGSNAFLFKHLRPMPNRPEKLERNFVWQKAQEAWNGQSAGT